jgi:hypothetical protein
MKCIIWIIDIFLIIRGELGDNKLIVVLTKIYFTCCFIEDDVTVSYLDFLTRKWLDWIIDSIENKINMLVDGLIGLKTLETFVLLVFFFSIDDGLNVDFFRDFGEGNNIGDVIWFYFFVVFLLVNNTDVDAFTLYVGETCE